MTSILFSFFLLPPLASASNSSYEVVRDLCHQILEDHAFKSGSVRSAIASFPEGKFKIGRDETRSSSPNRIHDANEVVLRRVRCGARYPTTCLEIAFLFDGRVVREFSFSPISPMVAGIDAPLVSGLGLPRFLSLTETVGTEVAHRTSGVSLVLTPSGETHLWITDTFLVPGMFILGQPVPSQWSVFTNTEISADGARLEIPPRQN